MATPGDCSILNSIFNPLLPLGQQVCDVDLPQEIEDVEDDGKEAQIAKAIEREAIMKAESGNIEQSIQLFNESIAISNTRPSGYNNRAQALRLKGDINAALKDLNRALELSQGSGKAACQAYCQRGLIYQLQDKKEAAESDFQSAAKMGSPFAKSMLVQMNPYAALCNQMLGEVIGKLQQRIIIPD